MLPPLLPEEEEEELAEDADEAELEREDVDAS